MQKCRICLNQLLSIFLKSMIMFILNCFFLKFFIRLIIFFFIKVFITLDFLKHINSVTSPLSSTLFFNKMYSRFCRRGSWRHPRVESSRVCELSGVRRGEVAGVPGGQPRAEAVEQGWRGHPLWEPGVHTCKRES